MATFLTYDNKPMSLIRNGRGPHQATILGIVGNCIAWEAPSQTGYGNKALTGGQVAMGITPLSDLEKIVIDAGEILPSELQFIASRN
jgi:hypothetical protein